VKWTKVALVLVIPALVLLFLGQSVRPPTVEAKPISIITINPTLCITLSSSLDWDRDGDVDHDDAVAAFGHCDNLDDASRLAELTTTLGGDPAHPKPEDFATVDMDGGQMHELDGLLFVIAFVGNDEPVSFYADEGVFPASGNSIWTCVADEDCNNDGVKGDGVAVAKLTPGLNIDRGPAIVRVRQGMLEIDEEYTVVGEPWNIEVSTMKPAIQDGAATCELFTDTPSFMAVLGAAEKAPLIATVTDSDGTPVTGALVAWEVDDPDKAKTANLPLVPTLVSDLGTAAPQVLCGQDDTGKVNVTAKITTGHAELDLMLDVRARPRHANVEVDVKGAPANMVLSASPGSLVCDGTATSTISATLTDAEGNPVLDGNVVRFEAKALGIVSPIEAKSVGGAATTTLTPLSAIAKGVAVRATLLRPEAEEADVDLPTPVPEPTPTPTMKEISVPDIEKSILVECASSSEAPGPEVPIASAVPAIAPPSTGDGGFLGP
jgi:hypothetical protein